MDKHEISEMNSQRFELALAFRQRSDDAANYLRGLLFALASGEIAFSASSINAPSANGELLGHLGAVALSAASLMVLVKSWELQKEKAGSRFSTLLTTNFSGDDWISSFDKIDRELKKPRWKRNQAWDRLAFVLILFAFAFEAGARLYPIPCSKPA